MLACVSADNGSLRASLSIGNLLRGQRLYGIVGQSRLYTANERTDEMSTAVVGPRHAWLGSCERRGLAGSGGAAGCFWGCCFLAHFFVLLL